MLLPRFDFYVTKEYEGKSGKDESGNFELSKYRNMSSLYFYDYRLQSSILRYSGPDGG